jgi:hypothetical protein
MEEVSITFQSIETSLSTAEILVICGDGKPTLDSIAPKSGLEPAEMA